MDDLVRLAIDVLQREVARAHAQVGAGEFRLIFSGLPRKHLVQLWEHLVHTSGGLSHLDSVVPVYLVDAGDPYSLRLSGRCRWADVIEARNSDANRMLVVLHYHADTVPASISSAFTECGQSTQLEEPGRHAHSDAWLSRNPLLHDAISLLQNRLAKAKIPNDDIVELVRAALADVSERDGLGPEEIHAHQWDLVGYLLAAASESNSRFVSTIGFPRTESGELDAKLQRAALSKLAERLQAEGVRGGLKTLDNQSEHVVIALSELEAHFGPECDGARFKAAPTFFFRCIGSEPNWQRTLTAELLLSLLDVGEEQNDEVQLEVEIADGNLLLRPTKGAKYMVTRTAPAFWLYEPNSETSGRVLARPEILAAIESARTSPKPMVRLVECGGRLLDVQVPEHKKPFTYSFAHPAFHTAVCKVVVLESYSPGFVIRATAAKGMKDTRPGKKNDKANWFSSLDFESAGSHQIDVYFDPSRMSILNAFIASAGTSLSKPEAMPDAEWAGLPLHTVAPGRALVQVSLDANSSVIIRLRRRDTNQVEQLLLEVSVGTHAAVHSSSVFDALVSRNREMSKQSPTVSVRVTALHAWINVVLAEPTEQLLSVGAAFSADFAVASDQESHARVRSQLRFLSDPRPTASKQQIPNRFVEVRATIHEILNAMIKERQISNLEELDLWLIARQPEHALVLHRYVQAYLEWLAEDPITAGWYEVYAAFMPEAHGPVLEPEPTAVLVSPLHPLRLAWMVLAQDRLRGAIDAGTPCPFPSILNPGSVPDALVLACATGADQYSDASFISVNVSSDYWGVLWHAGQLSRLRDPVIVQMLAALGLSVDGLASGMSEGQVGRAMTDLDALCVAQSILRVGLISHETGSESCTRGIADWCSRSLGEEDPWSAVSGRKVVIRDHRNTDLPDQDLVANLSHATGGAVEWYCSSRDDAGNGRNASTDLAILSHLGMLNPRLVSSDLRSGLSDGALVRHRIRRNHHVGEDLFIVESRVARCAAESRTSSLLSDTRRVSRAMEAKVGSLGFQHAPNWAALDAAVANARYCAVAASDADPSGFSRPETGTYLWDYEVPALAHRGIQDSGYYLVSRQCDEAINALRVGFAQLRSQIELSEDVALSLLAGVSNRGIPSLKQFFAGGAAAAGEIGVLAALELLQPDFSHAMRDTKSVLSPTDGQNLNLLIPIDPFRDQLTEIRKALCPKSSAARADLLVASISIPHRPNEPVHIKLTPVEVKCRGHLMTAKEQEKARSQNLAMIELLDALLVRSARPDGESDEPSNPSLWDLASRALLVSWLDFGFRVYARGCPTLSVAAWTKFHEEVTTRLLEGLVKIDVARVGRVIVIHNAHMSAHHDYDGDGFPETFELGHADAARLLAYPDDRSAISQRVFELIGNWDLQICHAEMDNFHQPESQPPQTAETIDWSAGEVSPDTKSAHVADAFITAAPIAEAGIRFNVGTTTRVLQPRPVVFYPSNTELNHLNVGIVGDMGTGKTQLTKYLITRMSLDARRNRGRAPRFLIFDYKKDYSKSDFVGAVGARLVAPEDIPLNILALPPREDGLPSGKRDWVKRANFLYDTLNRIYGGIGAVQRARLKDAVVLAYESAAPSGYAPMLRDVYENYEATGKPDSISSILSDLVDMGIFTENPAQVVDFGEFLEGVTVLQLNMLGANQQLKNSLVVFFLSLFYDFMIRLAKAPFAGTDPQLRFIEAMLLVDEADNIMKYDFEILRQILQEGREFGVGVLLASQYLSHFRRGDYDYREPLLTWFVHRVPDVSQKEVQGLGLAIADAETVARIKTLEKHEYFCTTLGESGTFAAGRTFWEMHRDAWVAQYPDEWHRLNALYSHDSGELAIALENAMTQLPPDVSVWIADSGTAGR
jgi:DNA phosphorothioation-dependent restriction protein DptH